MKVKFIGATDEQVNWAGGSDPRKCLKIGDHYTVEEEDVHSWHTKLYLEGIPGWFNSVCFEEVSEGGAE